MTTPEHDYSAATAPVVSTGATGGAAQVGGAADASIAARLSTIEEQPLDARAEAYVQLHDEMRDKLESGDAAGTQA